MHKVPPIAFLLPFLLFHSFACCQDSLRKKIKFSVAANMWMQQNYENNAKVSMPSYIKGLRLNTTRLPTRFDSLTDNPLKHGATYIVIKTSAAYADKVKINFDLFAEQRGASYGLFNKNNLLLYPVISIEGKDSFKISNQIIKLSIRAGMFLDEKMDEGLTIYNVDAQGVKVAFEKNKWQMQYALYADFYGGIGLNIDDLYNAAVKRKLGNNGTSEAGISFNYNKQLYLPLKNNFTLNIFGHKSFATTKVYAQLGFRPVNNDGAIFRVSSALPQKIATLLGLEYKYAANGFTITNTLEARYYGSIFNEGYYNFNLRYRQPASDIYEMYANTVGNFLYPLRKFNTPFSQWAVYTEYVYHSVFSINIRGDISRALGRKTALNLLYDLNYISAKNNFPSYSSQDDVHSNFIYPFFTASVSYKIIKEVETSLLLTNRSMNLDQSYPTYYLLSHPRFGVRLATSF